MIFEMSLFIRMSYYMSIEDKNFKELIDQDILVLL